LQGAEIISLERLEEEKYGSILCYPRFSSAEAAKRIRELKKLGVKAIEFAGDKTAFNVSVLGKGYVGIVVIAHTKTDRDALKIRRMDADRGGMDREASMLSKANSVGVGPRLIRVGHDFLLMQYIEGSLLPKWVANLSGRGTKRRIRQVLRKVLEQCFRLDEVGLDHGELSRAPKHVIVDAADKPYVLDFETASTARRVSNVTAICQYLFLGSQLAKDLSRKLGKINNEGLLRALRTYKLSRTRQNFVEILTECKL
jgi:putative serine/threonine protein kinase